jgi:hypothetical protein
MSAAETIHSSNPFTPKVLLRMGIGAIAGAAVGYLGVELLMHLHISPRQVGWSDAIALWISIVFIALGLVVGLVSTNRSRLAKELEPEATVPASAGEVHITRLQAAVLAIAGVLMGTPVFAQPYIAQHPGGNYVVFVSILVVFALQTWLNIRIWVASDEFLRKTILQVTALTFTIGQGLFFLAAAAEHLHLIAPISSWNVYSLLMLLYLLVTFYIGLRNQAR